MIKKNSKIILHPFLIKINSIHPKSIEHYSELDLIVKDNKVYQKVWCRIEPYYLESRDIIGYGLSLELLGKNNEYYKEYISGTIMDFKQDFERGFNIAYNITKNIVMHYGEKYDFHGDRILYIFIDKKYSELLGYDTKEIEINFINNTFVINNNLDSVFFIKEVASLKNHNNLLKITIGNEELFPFTVTLCNKITPNDNGSKSRSGTIWCKNDPNITEACCIDIFDCAYFLVLNKYSDLSGIITTFIPEKYQQFDLAYNITKNIVMSRGVIYEFDTDLIFYLFIYINTNKNNLISWHKDFGIS